MFLQVCESKRIIKTIQGLLFPLRAILSIVNKIFSPLLNILIHFFQLRMSSHILQNLSDLNQLYLQYFMYNNHQNHHSYRSYGHNNHYDRSRDKNYRRDRSNQKQDYDGRRRKRSRSSSNQRQGYRYDKSNQRGRSNSRQVERRQRQPDTYPERNVEQLQQRLRIAIRNNQIHYDANLLQISRGMSTSKQEQIKDQANSIERIHQCILVRELFISGLQEMNQHFIQQIMKQYGQIQKIQIVRNFAYVKFHRVEDASNACAEYHNINMRIHNMHNPNFKIFFADHVKRWNVVSNSINFESLDDLVPVVYASVKNQPPYNTQPHLREVFDKFGYIRNIQVKIPAMKPYKTYALVEYQTITQAMRARERIRPQRQKFLGDRKSQVTLLLDSQKVTRQCPNVKNQLRYQIKRQHNAASGNQIQVNNKTINPYMQSMQQQQQQQQQLQKPIQSIAQQNHQPSNNDTDIFAMIRQFAQKQQSADQEESDWVGFLTRKKQFKVQVDFNLIHKVPFELQSILNVSHRGDLQEGITREDYVMAGKFKASNNLNINAFNDYINYLMKKGKAGIIQSKNYLIYLLPPMQNLALPYPIKPDEILALFFKL